MLGIYIRLSQIDDASNSIDNQQRQGLQFAKSNQLEYEIYNEGEGLSGGLEEEGRPELKRLLDDAKSGKLTAIWVRDQSRLERNTGLWFKIADILRDNEVKLYYGEKFIDVDNDEEMFPTNIMSLYNDMIRKKQGRLTKRAINENFKESKSHGILPYGLTSDENRKLIINENEVIIVRRIYELSLSGIGTNKIAEILNADNVPTRYTKMSGTIKTKDKKSGKVTIRKKSDIKWSGNTVRGILRNPVYKGQRRSGIKTKLEYHPCPAIFTEDYWQKVNDNLTNNANNSGKKVEHKYLLKFVLRCGKCGRNYYGRTRENKKDHYYMCSSKRIKSENCGNRSINIDVIEELVWNQFIKNGELYNHVEEYFKTNSNNEVIESIDSDLESLENEQKSTKQELKKLIQFALKGVFTEDEIVSTKKGLIVKENDLKIKIQNLKARRDSITDKLYNLEDIESDTQRSETYSFNDKQELIKKYILDVRVRYHSELNKHFDDGEYFVEINFKNPDMSSYICVLNKRYSDKVVLPNYTPDGAMYLYNDIFEF